MESNESKQYVLLSYSSESKEIAEIVYKMLIEENIQVFFDNSDVNDENYDRYALFYLWY